MTSSLRVISNSTPKLNYDGDLYYRDGKSRFEENWKRKTSSWSQFVNKLSTPTVTPETSAEYHAMAKTDQDRIKDVGGFVGGELAGGRRKAENVLNRTMFCLDADFGTADLWATFCVVHNCAAVAYATHKYKPDKPRFRIVGPLKRPVGPDEYEAITRKMAELVGMDYWDDTTYQAHRLMYWPSIPSDIPYYFEVNDAPWLDPDEILAMYGPGDAWKDQSLWPESGRTAQVRKKLAEKQGDPLTKPGIVGAFCRTYSIPEAIETFLSDIYVPTTDGRYTYAKGTSASGLVLYDGDTFAFSHHGTDPISGKLVNAFDLVRLHIFGELDASAAPNTAVTDLPSYGKMADLAAADPAVKQTIGEERLATAAEEFGSLGEDIDWLKKMDTDRRGNYLSTPRNVLLILRNDPNLAGRVKMDEFAHKIIISDDLPWRKARQGQHWQDADDSGLRNYLHRTYRIKGVLLIQDAVAEYMYGQGYHPVKSYLGGLVWDGIERLETLLIDYFGAEDSAYVRAVTRKTFVAAAARVMTPGCKFDNMLVLVGRQGIGKSVLLAKMGGEWFTDSLDDLRNKDAYQIIQGRWIVEMGELAGMKKAEVEQVKHFLSKQHDHFRIPYGKHVGDFPRQCVFFGSTNRDDFLRDATGNRRFWPVKLEQQMPTRNVFIDLVQYEIDQLWAEAITLWKAGEPLYLNNDLITVALIEQEKHMDGSEKLGPIIDFLEMKLPENWKDMLLHERRQYLQGGDFGERQQGAIERTKVCAMEIWMELFGGDLRTPNRLAINEINDILRRVPGWKRYTAGNGQLRFPPPYGQQRCFVRCLSTGEYKG